MKTDTGCHLHPSCLTCPEEVCVFDKIDTKFLDNQTRCRQLYENGTPPHRIATMLGVTKRTVFRYLALTRA